MNAGLTQLLSGLATFVTLASIGAAPSFGQSPPDEHVFRTTTRLVQVSVTARDKSGKPTSDLKREEFQIFDNGSPQKIQVFVAQTSVQGASIPRPTGSFSNRITEFNGPHSGYSVILIDSLLATFLDPGPPQEIREHGSGLARLQTLKVLQSLPEGEKVAIYATERTFKVICEFTSDRERLEQALLKWKPSVDTPDMSMQLLQDARAQTGGIRDMAAAHKQLDEAMQKQLDDMSAIDMAGRVESSDGEMEAVAAHLAQIPGRKNLVWLSNRFGLGHRAIERFQRAGVSLYPIDMDGICEYCVPRPIGIMNAIAAATGGLAFYQRNDIDVAMLEAVEDGKAVYLLGFYAPEEEQASMHQLSVRVSRPDVTLRYTGSYQADSRAPAAADPVAEIVDAMHRNVDATGIGVTATVRRSETKLDLTANINISDLNLVSEEGLWKGKAEIAVRFLAVDGKPVGDTIDETLALNLRPERYEAMIAGGLPLQRSLIIPMKAVTVKLLIGNPGSGRVGTLSIPLSEVK